MGELVNIGSAKPTGNLACPGCGCEWLELAVNVDARTREIVGWAMRAKCVECGRDVALYLSPTDAEPR